LHKPSGNTSNSDFDVLSNQNTLSKVSSTYIPWSQFMDNTYTSGNCTDWTTGGTTRNIPQVAGLKKLTTPTAAATLAPHAALRVI
jgi:hypothetical protein